MALMSIWLSPFTLDLFIFRPLREAFRFTLPMFMLLDVAPGDDFSSVAREFDCDRCACDECRFDVLAWFSCRNYIILAVEF